MYVRFVTSLIDRKSHERLGVIRSAWYYQDGDVNEDDSEELDDLFSWFNDFLIVPHRFSRAKKKRGIDVATKRAISWFKDSAKLHIRKARQICDVLERNGIATEMLTSKNPGYVVYEDEYQVAAIPFA